MTKPCCIQEVQVVMIINISLSPVLRSFNKPKLEIFWSGLAGHSFDLHPHFSLTFIG